MQNFYNLNDITVKINVSLKKLASEDDTGKEDPFIMIEVENDKYMVKKRDVRRLEKLDATRDFQTILESKVDINFKIAKILTNAIGWRVDFEDFQQGKQTLLIPAKKFLDANRATPKTVERIPEVKEESQSEQEPKEEPPEPLKLPLLSDDEDSKSEDSDESQK